MNSLERVVGTMMGMPVDRHPFFMNLSLYGARLSGRPVDEHYRNADAFVEGMIAVRETFNVDAVTSPFAFAIEGEAFGSRTEVRGRQAPILVEPAITGPNNISRIKLPDVDQNPQIRYLRETVRGLAARYGGEVPVCGLMHSPFSLPIMIMGLENWLQTILFHDHHREEMLDISKAHFRALSNAFVSDGAQMLMVPSLCVNPSVLTQHLVEQVVLPVYREVFADLPVPLIVHHAGKQMGGFVDMLADIPQVTGFVVDSSDDPYDVRRRIGPERLVLSGIDGPTLERRSSEDVTATCRELAEPCAEDPRFIPMTTCADIPYMTPIENIHAASAVMSGSCEELVHAS